MANDAMRAMLDGLMGADRDMTENDKEKNRRTFDDPMVDKAYLIGCSPWELLSETSSEKMLPANGWDLIKDAYLRKEWNKLTQEEKDKYGFEYDIMKLLEDLVVQCDRKIAQNRRRVEEEEQLPPEFALQVANLDAEIKALQEKANTLGEGGDVDGSMQCINDAQEMVEQREKINNEHKPKARRPVVCDLSGAMISEADRHRLEDGKMYRGWNMIRMKLKEFQEREGGPPKPKPRMSYREREEEKRQESGGGDRDKDRDKDRERRSRSRDRDRGRERYSDSGRRRDRYDDYDRRRDDRSRDSRRRERSRSRSRSRDRRR